MPDILGQNLPAHFQTTLTADLVVVGSDDGDGSAFGGGRRRWRRVGGNATTFVIDFILGNYIYDGRPIAGRRRKPLIGALRTWRVIHAHGRRVVDRRYGRRFLHFQSGDLL